MATKDITADAVLADPDRKPNPNLVDPTRTVTRQRVTRQGPSETSLQTLKRLFGEVVFEMFPQEIIEAVDASYNFWQEHPDSYLVTPFESEAAKNDALALMRAYAEIADPDGYTIRTLKDSPDSELHWRAQNRIKHGQRD
jgi:hypothetical protein